MRFRFAALVLLGLAAPAEARDFYYFHKARVTSERFQADRLECERLMGGSRKQRAAAYVPPSNLTAAQGAAASGIFAFFDGMMRSSNYRRTLDAIERTCMADKGYDRYRVPEDFAEELEDIAFEERLVRYFDMAAADEPVGEKMVE